MAELVDAPDSKSGSGDFADGDQISFRADTYGWDAKTLQALDAATAGHV